MVSKIMYWSQIKTDNESYNFEYFSQGDVCRLCWNKNAEREIQAKNCENMSEKSLADIIMDCLQIELNNLHVNKICNNCCDEVNRFYSYKKFCQDTDSKLKIILEKRFEEIKLKDSITIDVKCEELDERFDIIADYFRDTEPVESTEFQEATEQKLKTKSSPKVRKKYRKRSPTYCNICRINLETKEVLSEHNRELHGIENDGTLFKCFGCEKRFKTRKARLGHERNFCKGLNDGYKCDICNRFLATRFMYEFHMRDHRRNKFIELPEHLFKCTKCPNSFESKELLRSHLTEHGIKHFVCDICGRLFTRQDYLYKHKLTHTGTKRHECPHCDFKATQRSSLIVHIRKHTGERPYSCDMCPQRCTSSSNLRAHRKRHLGVNKKFECTICNKKFGYKMSLEEHISSAHVRSESHPCEHCGATYTRIRGLRRHLAAKHGKQAKSKPVEQNLLVQVTDTDGAKIDILKQVEYELKDGENVLLLKHQDGDVYMV